MRRRLLAALGVVALVVTAGCTGGGGVDQQALERDYAYDWNTTADATVTVEGGEYHAVVDVGNESAIYLSTSDQLSGRSAVSISAARFRYPNGTVVGPGNFSVRSENSQTVVEFPAANGTFAYTAGAGSRSVVVPVVVDGTHELVLPEGMRVSLPIIGVVSPGGYEQRVVDDRVHLSWTSPDGDALYAQYYFLRDLYIFGGLAAVLALVATAGVVYFRIRIRGLEDEREAAGLDLEREE